MKILIFNPSFLGDSVLTTPLIQAVKAKYPEAQISFCVRPEYVPLFDGLAEISEVIPFDKRRSYSGLSGIFRFAKYLEQRGFDIVLTPHKSFRTNLTLWLAKIPVRVGFVESAFSALLTSSCARYMDLHEVQRNLTLYEAAFGEYPAKYPLKVVIDQEKKAEFAKLGENLIGIAPGSVWATKMWPAERFAEVADRLKEDGYTPVIIGAPEDVPAAEKLMKAAKYEHINMCGKTSLKELPALIANFGFMVTNDSGPMHIAVAAGVRCIAIFGPTVKELGFTPYDEVSRVAEVAGLNCRPCGLHGSRKCPKKHFRCMLEISTQDVLALLEKEQVAEPIKPKYETVKAD
ncbi:lipopolysaccharide heptosyltransferase II [Seleniivibrio sp.]|uniref:lipopolysaccharide heptosyltransferase II n=1 Tax=Seleniivibrio sp. TaxID=2898801 RepID=UPI0025E616B8|nr:lipopolysaccharide heptosyltransferase II [Seleniivibrio sp.]MCD8554427.1 lipopolysaccharide heptosyltransferase II [Seleniivibrio sp.]